MKKIITITALAISVIVTTFEARAVSVFDGIYNTTPNIGYVIFREQNGSMVGVLNQTVNNVLEWSAAQGPLIGNSARLTSIIGYNNLVIDINFTSTATFTATQVSCTPVQYCLFQNGTSFTGLKIW